MDKNFTCRSPTKDRVFAADQNTLSTCRHRIHDDGPSGKAVIVALPRSGFWRQDK